MVFGNTWKAGLSDQHIVRGTKAPRDRNTDRQIQEAADAVIIGPGSVRRDHRTLVDEIEFRALVVRVRGLEPDRCSPFVLTVKCKYEGRSPRDVELGRHEVGKGLVLGGSQHRDFLQREWLHERLTHVHARVDHLRAGDAEKAVEAFDDHHAERAVWSEGDPLREVRIHPGTRHVEFVAHVDCCLGQRSVVARERESNREFDLVHGIGHGLHQLTKASPGWVGFTWPRADGQLLRNTRRDQDDDHDTRQAHAVFGGSHFPDSATRAAGAGLPRTHAVPQATGHGIETGVCRSPARAEVCLERRVRSVRLAPVTQTTRLAGIYELARRLGARAMGIVVLLGCAWTACVPPELVLELSTGGGGPGGGGMGGMGECPSPETNIPIANQQCDLYLQNCPAPDTCEIAQVSADPYVPGTACVSKNGLKGIGESCAALDECEMTLTCVASHCTPFCCEGNDSVCEGGACDLNVTLLGPMMEETMYQFWACSFAQPCELFDPETCPPEENCYLTADPVGGACYQPAQVPEVPEGGTCSSLNDCLDSSICIGQAEMSVCRYLCLAEPEGAPPGLGGCPGGQLCDTEAFDTGFAGVGFCHP